MKTKELIELAQLHALGLLDEADATDFEAALSAASPGVVAQIRREQARLSQLETVLPDVQPRPELRGLVVDAVARAMVPKPAALQHEAGRIPAIIPGRRVSRVWRTAAVSSAVIALVLSFFTFHVKSIQSALQQKIEDDAITASIAKEIGPQHANDLLFGDNVRRVFEGKDPAFHRRAALVMTPRTDSGRFYYNLPADNVEIYQLIATDDTGAQVGDPLIKEFTSTGGIQSQMVRLNVKGATQLAIRAGLRSSVNSAVTWTVVATTRIA